MATYRLCNDCNEDYDLTLTACHTPVAHGSQELRHGSKPRHEPQRSQTAVATTVRRGQGTAAGVDLTGAWESIRASLFAGVAMSVVGAVIAFFAQPETVLGPGVSGALTTGSA